MVVLVRCKNDVITLALTRNLKSLISEGLITAYLSPEGWVNADEVPARPKLVRKQPVPRVCAATKPCLPVLASAPSTCDSLASLG